MNVGRGAWPRRGRAKQFQAADDAGQAAGTHSTGQQWPPGTLISGTMILDSGFLSNMRVMRSFKSSAMSGLWARDTSEA